MSKLERFNFSAKKKLVVEEKPTKQAAHSQVTDVSDKIKGCYIGDGRKNLKIERTPGPCVTIIFYFRITTQKHLGRSLSTSEMCSDPESLLMIQYFATNLLLTIEQ